MLKIYYLLLNILTIVTCQIADHVNSIDFIGLNFIEIIHISQENQRSTEKCNKIVYYVQQKENERV